MNKIRFTILSVIVLCLVMGGCANPSSPDEGDVTYSVGDTGPAGGTIVYVNSNSATDGWTYLEATPSQISGACLYTHYSSYSDLSTSTEIGYGKSNTKTITGSDSSADIAAYICDNYELNSYADWFLPSLEELRCVIQCYSSKISDSNCYWSSSSANTSQAWCISGTVTDGKKTKGSNNLRVFAVRRF